MVSLVFKSYFVSRRNQNPLHNFDCSSLKRVLVCVAIFLCIVLYLIREKWCFLFLTDVLQSQRSVTLFGDLLHGISNDFDTLGVSLRGGSLSFRKIKSSGF